MDDVKTNTLKEKEKIKKIHVYCYCRCSKAKIQSRLSHKPHRGCLIRSIAILACFPLYRKIENKKNPLPWALTSSLLPSSILVLKREPKIRRREKIWIFIWSVWGLSIKRGKIHF